MAHEGIKEKYNISSKRISSSPSIKELELQFYGKKLNFKDQISEKEKEDIERQYEQQERFWEKKPKEKLSHAQKRQIKEAEEKKMSEFVHKPLKKKIINYDKEIDKLDFNDIKEKSIFKNIETINYEYSSETVNNFAQIIYYCEKVNFGNFSLFKIFWDILKLNFWKMTNDNKILFIQSLCETNFNLLYFKEEIDQVFDLFIQDQDSIIWDEGNPSLNIRNYSDYHPILECYNEYYGQRYTYNL